MVMMSCIIVSWIVSEETGFRGGRKMHGLESFKVGRSFSEMKLIVFVLAA